MEKLKTILWIIFFGPLIILFAIFAMLGVLIIYGPLILLEGEWKRKDLDFAEIVMMLNN